LLNSYGIFENAQHTEEDFNPTIGDADGVKESVEKFRKSFIADAEVFRVVDLKVPAQE
jgi:hypothetical protein